MLSLQNQIPEVVLSLWFSFPRIWQSLNAYNQINEEFHELKEVLSLTIDRCYYLVPVFQLQQDK